jgi:hypothetical protein
LATEHPLILEGIDLVLKKRGMPSIKELTKTADMKSRPVIL